MQPIKICGNSWRRAEYSDSIIPAYAITIVLQRNVPLKPPSPAAFGLRRGRRSERPCAVKIVVVIDDLRPQAFYG